MSKIEIKDLDQEITITEEELKHVKGGLLSPNPLPYHKIPLRTDKDINIDTFHKFY